MAETFSRVGKGREGWKRRELYLLMRTAIVHLPRSGPRPRGGTALRINSHPIIEGKKRRQRETALPSTAPSPGRGDDPISAILNR